MYKIQEVVHRFRSGSLSERKDSDGEEEGVASGAGMPPSSSSSLSSSPAAGVRGASLHTSNNSSSQASDKSAKEAPSGKWYMVDHADIVSSNLPLSEKAGLSSLPVITPAGLHQTKLPASGSPGARPRDSGASAILGNRATAGLESGVGKTASSSSSALPASPDKKPGKTRPQGTLEYKVGKDDTLEKIAAHFDVTPSELKKLNRLSFHMVFENQILYIPDPNYQPSNPSTPEPLSPINDSPVHVKPKMDIPIVKMAVNRTTSLQVPSCHSTPNPPSSAPPVPPRTPFSPFSASPFAFSPFSRFFSGEGGGGSETRHHPHQEEEERFIKLSSQMISDGFEKIPGTLLVTPNAIMFEPDVRDDRVLEEGAEHYGAVVYMDAILSAAIYQDLSALRFHARCSSENDLLEKPEVYRGADGGSARARSASTSSLLDTTKPPPFSSSTSSTPHPPPPSGPAGRILASLFLQSSSSSLTTNTPSPGTALDSTSARVEEDFARFSFSPLVPEASSDCATEGRGGEAAAKGRKADSKRVKDWTEMLTDESGFSSSAATAPDSDQKCGGGSSSRWRESDSQSASLPSERTGQEVTKKADAPDSIAIEQNAKSGGFTARGLPAALCVESPGQSTSSVLWGDSSKVEGGGGCSFLVDQQPEDVLEEIMQSLSSGGDGSHSQTRENTTATTTSQDRSSSGYQSWSESVLQQNSERGEGETKAGSWASLSAEDGGKSRQSATGGALSTDCSQPSSSTRPRSHSGKHRPPPLSFFGLDAPDAASSTLVDGESRRSRALSESFSPLRSSAQHLSNLVNYATGLFRGGGPSDDRAGTAKDGDHAGTSSQEVDGGSREEEDKEEGRGSGSGEGKGQGTEFRFTNAVKAEERPELFRKISDIIPPHEDVHKQPAVYLHLRVDTEACDHHLAASTPSEAYRNQTTKPHYWFSVPRNRGDHLYAFFIHWRPDLYGDDDISPEDRGFVVVDRVDVTQNVESLAFMDDHFSPTLSSSFKKDWEIMSREELRRRTSLIQDADLNVMPEMSEESVILTQEHVMELGGKLPARTVGYQWSLVYSTGQHGFSLKRLYRELGHLDSPVLLVLQDTQDVVFGAYLSDPPRLSDHFYGTGTCQLWTLKDKLQVFNWSGNNPYFIKGDDSGLSVGASQGTYGLWIDNDLYHGHSQPCSTFNNGLLTNEEDFILRALEAWAFSN